MVLSNKVNIRITTDNPDGLNSGYSSEGRGRRLGREWWIREGHRESVPGGSKQRDLPLACDSWERRKGSPYLHPMYLEGGFPPAELGEEVTDVPGHTPESSPNFSFLVN